AGGGEARGVGARLAAQVRALRGAEAGEAGMLLGGEPAVTLRGDGRGGRKQELALAAALALDGVEGVVVASFATDGVDGPTEAAGAIATGVTALRGRVLRLDPAAHLDRNDRPTVFAQNGGQIRRGPRGTNGATVLRSSSRPAG